MPGRRAPPPVGFVMKLRATIQSLRTQAQQKGFGMVLAGQSASAPTDYLVNLDEAALAKEAETLETILGTLDGQLSLKNATVMIDV